MDSRIEKINEKFREMTLSGRIVLKAERGETGILESKFGGQPYLPRGFHYPQTPDGVPLRLLAQLNMAELPHIDEFPKEGILQFYIANEDIMGLDFDDPLSQKGFRVIYHDRIDDRPENIQPGPDFEEVESYMPFEGEFRLLAQSDEMPMPTEDFRFNETYMTVYNQYMDKQIADVWSMDEAEDLCEAFSDSGHRIGGYPFFTQNDPREYGDLNNYTIMLLQIDSEFSGDGKWDIIWGDCGVANFFITPEQLAKRDFSKVLYNWDCC